MTARATSQMVAVAGKAENWLGWLLWYTISDLRITREKLAEAFESVGLDSRHLPNPISPRDAFRRASALDSYRAVPLKDGTFLRLMVREVSVNKEGVVRNLVREIVDEKNRRLSHASVVALTLEEMPREVSKRITDRRGRVRAIQSIVKDTNLKMELLKPLLRPEEELLVEIRQQFAIHREHYGGVHVREVVRRILEAANPVAVRPSGGVYFVGRDHALVVDSVEKLVNEHLASAVISVNRTQLDSIPVINDERRRGMIQGSLEEQVTAETDLLLEEMANLLKSQKAVKPKVVNSYVDRVKSLQKMTKEYEDLLQTELLGLTSNLKVLAKQATTLMEAVDTE